MSTLLKPGGSESEPEQPLREGWLVKQSGGASGRTRRRSVGEIMKKWMKNEPLKGYERQFAGCDENNKCTPLTAEEWLGKA